MLTDTTSCVECGVHPFFMLYCTDKIFAPFFYFYTPTVNSPKKMKRAVLSLDPNPVRPF